MKLTDEKILELAVESDLSYESKFGGHYSPFAEGTNLQHFILDFARAILKEAGVEEMERDAERYRWLRDDNATEFGEPWAITRFEPGDERNTDGGTCLLTGKELDRAIDEAMKAK